MAEHLKGQRCRALDWASVALREQHPSEFSEVDIMLQPAAYMDGVLLAWTVAAQALRSRRLSTSGTASQLSSTTLLFATQKVLNQASAAILGKMTQALQVTDTDYAMSFKAACHKTLEERRTAWRTAGALGNYKARSQPQPTLAVT